jgi:hypothetical protein
MIEYDKIQLMRTISAHTTGAGPIKVMAVDLN